MEGKALHLQGLIMGSAIGSLGYVTIHEMLWKAKKQLSFLSFLTWASEWIFTNNEYLHYSLVIIKDNNIIICIFFLFLQNIIVST